MEGLRQYVLSVICAALIVSILLDLSAKTSFRKQLSLVCGIFLGAVILRPLANLTLPGVSFFTGDLAAQAQEAAQLGENIRIRSLGGIIRRECEAYILKEAGAMGAQVEAEVELDYGDPPAPAAVTVRGTFEEAAETALSTLIAENLGIPKEHQTWIRQPKPSSGASSENTSTFF